MYTIQNDENLKRLVNECVRKHKKDQRIWLDVSNMQLIFTKGYETPNERCKLLKERYEYVTRCNPRQWFTRAIKNAL